MRVIIAAILLASTVDAFVAQQQHRPALRMLSMSAVPYIPDGYSQKEWQAEHEAELAQLQARKEEFIGHRGTASQPVRHFQEDIDQQTVVHFHKPAASRSATTSDTGTTTARETVLHKMRRRWGRDTDDDELVP